MCSSDEFPWGHSLLGSGTLAPITETVHQGESRSQHEQTSNITGVIIFQCNCGQIILAGHVTSAASECKGFSKTVGWSRISEGFQRSTAL